MENYNEDIKKAVDTLRAGGIILYPTDTIWGIGCDATNSKAVRRVFDIKHRADSKALITLVGSLAALERTVEEVPDVAYQLLEVADKPMTIVYDHGRGVAPELLAEDGSIGVRLTTEPFSAVLCKAFGRPLVSTSANISGEPAPAHYGEISQEILGAADYVCTSRRDETAPAAASTVIKLSAGGVFKILRK
jgi:L-threonylcarbamoyladenylate synthase